MCVQTPGEVDNTLFSINCCSYLPNFTEICERFFKVISKNTLVYFFVDTLLLSLGQFFLNSTL